MAKKIIIFDFDNTLVKTRINFSAMKIQMAQSVKKYGLNFGKLEEIPKNYTAGNIIDQAEIYDQENNTNITKKLWKIVEKYERLGMADLTIDKEILNVLDDISDFNYPLAILTNNAKKPTLEVIKRFNIEAYFDLVIAREDVAKMKPDSEGLDLVIKHFSADPKNAVFIGDSWVDGVAANNANIRFILYKEKTLEAKRHEIKIWKHIKTMKELLPIIKEEF
ncbi:MAG: HAD family hydrolase [Promethearchaeota archaeon]|nr:MAG: HAD family hydrolase [Candidatus Lokiarchaeota archaeon]